jgi:hypothetical protein
MSKLKQRESYWEGYRVGFADGRKIEQQTPKSWVCPGLLALVFIVLVVASLAGTAKKWVPPAEQPDPPTMYLSGDGDWYEKDDMYLAPDGHWYPKPTLADPE